MAYNGSSSGFGGGGLQNDYRLGKWTVQPQRGCIESGGDVVHLKPKVMAVLNCLASANGQVVKRDDLFEKVWPGQVVADATLTQCVVELRHAFGDSAKNPQVVETIPRVGFRLIPEVVPVSPTQGASSAATSTKPESASPLFSMRSLALVVAVVIVSVLAIWQLASNSETAESRTTPELIGIAVLPFEDLSTAQDLGAFADSLATALTNSLQQHEEFQVVARNDAFLYRGRNQRLDEIAAELDVFYIVQGSVRRSGDDLIVSGQLNDARDGSQVWRESLNWPTANMEKLIEMFAESVAFALTIEFGLSELEGLTTNPVAYWLLHYGDIELMSSWRQGSAEAMLSGIDAIGESLYIDPDNHWAWGGLAHWYAWMSLLRDDSVIRDWLALSMEAHEESLRILPDAPEGPGVPINLYTQTRQWSKAEQQLVEWENQLREMMINMGEVEDAESLSGCGGFPISSYCLYFWGIFLDHVGRPVEALAALQDSRRQDPQGYGAIPFRERFIARTHLLLNHPGAALDKYQDAWDEENIVRRLGSFEATIAALASGDRETLLLWLDRAVEHADTEYKNWFRAMRDRLDDPLAAKIWLNDAFESREGGPGDPFVDPFIMNFAAHFGDTQLALRAMRRSQDSFWLWSPLLGDARAQPEFRELVFQLGLVDYWREYGWGEFCRPAEDAEFVCE